ncbi:MAG: hypothetical protein Q8P33_00430 [bacterium]|nr:hypothetical protein [bacterium]
MKRYVIGLTVAALSSGAALAVILVFLNPNTAKWLGVSLLLVSAFFLVASVFTLIGFTIRVLRSRKEVIYAHLATAFRQGLLLAVVVVGSLLLQIYRIFNIWSALLFVAAVVLVELAFQSHSSSMQLRQSRALPSQTLDQGKVRDITTKPQAQPWKTRFPTKNDQAKLKTEPTPLNLRQPKRIPVNDQPQSMDPTMGEQQSE